MYEIIVQISIFPLKGVYIHQLGNWSFIYSKYSKLDMYNITSKYYYTIAFQTMN